MFKYFRDTIVERINHPILGLMYVIAGFLLFLSGVAIVLNNLGILNNPWTTRFLGVFAVFFASIATLGYVTVFLSKGISIVRDRMGIV